ncbi:hypothetical protein LNV09_24580 [Paucibacter sp. B2R-40]|uniref:hypothetical protein n=1 Tax=Paucibacter sp. B2R-40 TaxID=2893554 RepID=UPI0021E44AA6|nr:hypothetical protein [Paucibacter sp. B2R-40]MCV2357329.1 hypothetical protein [Paucibacter sp. B2R-40]
MTTVLIAAALLGIVLLLLAMTLVALAFLWRFLPISQRASEVSFMVFAALLVTPVPVGLGVGAMVYPVAVLYQDIGQLKWHFEWYANAPELLLPSLAITIAFAYIASHRLLPNLSSRRGGEK